MKNILYEGYLGPRLPREVQLKRVQRVMQEELTPLQRKWSDEHWLLQYDLMFGKGYALGRMGLEGLAEDAE